MFGEVRVEVWLVLAREIIFVAGVVVRVVFGKLWALGPVLFLYPVLLGWLGPVPAAIVVLGVVVIAVLIFGTNSAWHPRDLVSIRYRVIQQSREWRLV